SEHIVFSCWVSFPLVFIQIYFGEGEWFYTLRFAQSHKMRNAYAVYFVATDDILPDAESEPDYGELDPPQDLPISRFTLCHPFLRDELHDPDGIRLFWTA